MMIRYAAIWSLGAFCLVMVLRGPLSGAETPDFNRPDFNRDVRPILSAHCFKCHGPDDKTREAGLRLDERKAATAELESGATAIVPERPAESELVSRILATDEGLVMPPPAANKPLSAAQKEILQKWIAAGAEYAPHWAFLRPKQAPLPAVKQTDWPQNPIDHFTLARMEAAGLAPSPAADKYTLVRRVYLDLIGIPPTPAEADAFVNDDSPKAYEALVDRLLKSPHYGERWARRWLDLARYADTNGYEKDRVRTMWPYRDWVIDAINRDLPFDQFTIEQIAGDMLPGATLDQRIATGFHRNTMINEEGGIDPLEFRYYASVDRINTTATVWLGLTLGCAQCHTHKFDPIPHEDYYRLMAFLDNADEPTIDVPQDEIAAQRAKIEEQIARLEAEFPAKFPLPSTERVVSLTPDKINSAAGATAEKLPDGSIRLSGEPADKDTYTLELVSDGPIDAASLRLEALADPMLPKDGPGRTPHGNFVVTEVSVTVASLAKPAEIKPIQLASAASDFAQDGFPPEHMFDGKPNTGWAIHGPGKWNVSRTATLRFAEPVKFAGPARWTVKIDQQYGSGHTLGRMRLSLVEQIPVDAARSEEERRREHLEQKFAAWKAEKSQAAVKWQPLKPLSAKSDIPTLAIEADHTVFASGDMSKRDIYDLTYDTAGIDRITAIRLECLTDERLPKRGPGRIYYEGPFGDFFLSKVTVRTGPSGRLAPEGATPLAERADHGAQADHGAMATIASAGQSFASGNSTADKAIDDDPQSGWSINGGQGQSQWATFVLEQPLTGADRINLQLLFERYYAAGLGKFRVYATSDPRVTAESSLPTSVENLLALSAKERTPDQIATLRAQFLATASELAPARAEIDKLKKSLPEFPTTLVMQERPKANPRATHVHHRGEFLQPKDPVEPQVLSIFPPLAADQPHDRLAFARWLVDPANPLVGRVTMNRQWAAFFGRGIVRTPEDFGYQGDAPTHPELLDWLAVEFVNQGWSMKRMHKLIVMSATYRQSAAVRPESLAIDPENKLLARFPRQRLEGELVRDSVLAAAGLLSPKIGGPSVFPPQPASITAEGAYGSFPWKVSEGEDRYRRGLYTFMKRTAPYAMFQTFDAPSGEACLARREVTNTPLQALTVLNDAVMLEAAQALGNLAATSGRDPGRDPSQQLTDIFRRCLSRPPTAEETRLLIGFYESQLARLKAGKLDAAKIAGAGDGDATERAAWTLVARAILNLDETIVKE
jgi:hypothetical protein